jgi:hypothetical protein
MYFNRDFNTKQIEEKIVKQKQQHECRSQSPEQLPRGSQKHSKKSQWQKGKATNYK